MKQIYWGLIVAIICFGGPQAFTQGPPITADKPIMLGSNSIILRTLTEVRSTQEGTFTKVPFMVHYLPTSNTLLALHVPYVSYNFHDTPSGTSTLGDIELLAKYQFYRKDKTGKTFRMVAKTLQTFPTGATIDVDGMSTGRYQSYVGTVAGYESIKYGISNELGYNFIPDGDQDELRYKLGFGLPLLKSTYPVKQVNLYFEYQSSWFFETKEYLLLYAQGIQYAKGRLTLEASFQLPLKQTIAEGKQRNYSLFLGTRYIF